MKEYPRLTYFCKKDGTIFNLCSTWDEEAAKRNGPRSTQVMGRNLFDMIDTKQGFRHIYQMAHEACIEKKRSDEFVFTGRSDTMLQYIHMTMKPIGESIMYSSQILLEFPKSLSPDAQIVTPDISGEIPKKQSIPICMHCHDYRTSPADDKWHPFTRLLSEEERNMMTDGKPLPWEFTHGLCLPCMDKYYPEYLG